jgi:hypothetical protein
LYHLATLFPWIRRFDPLPVSRDQLMLIMAAINEIFLGIDIFLAHSISGTIVPGEWIPIVFGPIAGLILIAAGLLARQRRNAATWLATAVFLMSIAVGLLGAYFHIVRASLPSAPVDQRITIGLLVWAPPVLGPLTFSLVGLLGLSAAWIEQPVDSGSLRITPSFRMHLPLSKTRAYFLMVSLGSLATLISSVLDHARTPYINLWLWMPTLVGIFAVVAAALLGGIKIPSRGDLGIFLIAMLALILTGVVGALLHIDQNLIAQGAIVPERFIRGAPFLAPLLFANMGTLGLITLLDPAERA